VKWIPLTRVSEHEDIGAGVADGKQKVEAEDFDFGYDLYAYEVKGSCAPTLDNLSYLRQGTPGRLETLYTVWTTATTRR
jgi:hypothetical protein